MIRRNIIIICMCLLVASYSLAHAEYAWPVDTQSISSITNKFMNGKRHLIIESEGEVFSIHDGRVLFTRHKDNEAGLPSVVEIISDRGILISYLYVNSHVSIGDVVKAGDIIGASDENQDLFLRIYDYMLDTDIEPLSILPEIDRFVVIKLQSMTFTTGNGENNEKEVVSIGRRIYGGASQVELIFSIRDRGSQGYILPKTVWVDIADESFIVTMDDLFSNSDYYTILPDGMVKIVLPHVTIPYGYIDIFITVKTPLQGRRYLKFNTFAARQTFR